MKKLLIICSVVVVAASLVSFTYDEMNEKAAKEEIKALIQKIENEDDNE